MLPSTYKKALEEAIAAGRTLYERTTPMGTYYLTTKPDTNEELICGPLSKRDAAKLGSQLQDLADKLEAEMEAKR